MGQFSALILVLLLVAFWLKIDFIFYLVYVSLGLYAWNLWRSPRMLAQIRAERAFDDHAFWGEEVPVAIHLHNESRLAIPWLQLHESVATELVIRQNPHQALALKGRAEVRFDYRVQTSRRGYYRLGPLSLKSSDLFGFFPEQVRSFPADYLTVYPRIWTLSELGLPSRLPFGTIASRQRLFADPARPMGTRPFRSGDSLRQINWKASAHTQDLLVKTFEPAISLETAVLLNLHRDDYQATEPRYASEWAIEVAASLAAHLVDLRQPVGLISNGLDPLQRHPDAQLTFDETTGRLLPDQKVRPLLPPPIPPRPGRPHLMKLLGQLARLELSQTVPFPQWAATACLGLSWGVTLLVITPSGDEATCYALHRLVRSGFNPILLVVEPDREFSLVRERARQLGFTAYHIMERRDLQKNLVNN
jgi:hypothetical protein